MLNYADITLPPMADPLMQGIRRRFERHYLETFGHSKGTGLYSEHDWRRLDWMAAHLPRGGSILDVGVGPGAFLNYLTLCGLYDQAVGIDIRPYSKYFEVDVPLDRRIMSATDMDFADRSFDTVVCMEVLEHLERQDFESAMGELKRVCAGRLFLTVPFEEPLPLPSYHKLRFLAQDIQEVFPGGTLTLLRKGKAGTVPWMLVEIDCSQV
jgi:2-polyprenyl-3-methyl-5-hydroxy-6-metoxy-1,4-benzoquinol methylase